MCMRPQRFEERLVVLGICVLWCVPIIAHKDGIRRTTGAQYLQAVLLLAQPSRCFEGAPASWLLGLQGVHAQ